jgi:hypothetical protein
VPLRRAMPLCSSKGADPSANDDVVLPGGSNPSANDARRVLGGVGPFGGRCLLTRRRGQTPRCATPTHASEGVRPPRKRRFRTPRRGSTPRSGNAALPLARGEPLRRRRPHACGAGATPWQRTPARSPQGSDPCGGRRQHARRRGRTPPTDEVSPQGVGGSTLRPATLVRSRWGGRTTSCCTVGKPRPYSLDEAKSVRGDGDGGRTATRFQAGMNRLSNGLGGCDFYARGIR